MNLKELTDIRAAIKSGARRFFRTDVEVEERLLQALQFTDARDGEGGPSSTVLLHAAFLAQPGIGRTIDEGGMDIQSADLPELYPFNDEDAFVPQQWFNTFEPWFRIIDEPDTRVITRKKKHLIGKPTRSYIDVRQGKQLSLSNAILGCLEAKYLDDRMGYRGLGDVSTNDLVGIFAKKIGAEASEGNKHCIDENAINRLCENLSDRFKTIYSVDPSAGSQQFILYHDGKDYRFRPFGSWGAYQLQEAPLRDGSLWVVRANIVQPLQIFRAEAIDELESLIQCDAREQEFQRFFEQNSEFLLALGDYKAIHPQLILHEDDGGRLIPDFFLEKINSDLCDICDLKRPTAELIRFQRHRTRFRDAIHEAVAQIDYYRDWFEDRAHRDLFKSKYGISSYRPKVVMVVGRQLSFYDDIQRIKLETDLPPWVSLKTYDDIVAKARHWRNLAENCGPQLPQ